MNNEQQQQQQPQLKAKEDKPANHDDYDFVIDIPEIGEIAKKGYICEFSPAVQQKIKKHVAENMNHHLELANDGISSFNRIIPFDRFDALGSILDHDNNLRVAFTGLFNRGKTFCINHLAKVLGHNTNLLSGNQYSTKGLSFILSKFMLLDTMGMNSALLLESINRAKKLIEHEFPEVPLPKNSNIQSEFNEYRKKCNERDIKFNNRAYELATINKKCVESFLQNLIFNLTNVVVVVVNELTFIDQMYISGVVKSLKNYFASQARRGLPLNKYKKVIVLHNYHTCSEHKEFNELKTKYVDQVYLGKTTMVDVSVSGAQMKIPVHESNNSETTHLFIAKEGSKAGANNNATFTYLQQIFQTLSFPSDTSIVTNLCMDMHYLLGKYLKHISAQVDLVTNDTCEIAFKMINCPKALQYHCNKLDYSDGFEMTLSKGNAYDPRIDIRMAKNYFLVLVDAAGITSGKNAHFKTTDSQISAKMTIEGDLEIRGRRSLSRRAFKISEQGTVTFSPDVCDVYASEDESKKTIKLKPEDWEMLERPYGSFIKRIHVPPKYDRMNIYSLGIEDGVFAVLLKLREGSASHEVA